MKRIVIKALLGIVSVGVVTTGGVVVYNHTTQESKEMSNVAQQMVDETTINEEHSEGEYHVYSNEEYKEVEKKEREEEQRKEKEEEQKLAQEKEQYNESNGYGDYVKGEHVPYKGTRIYKFVETSGLGCKHVTDKSACKASWIAYFEPKLQELKGEVDRAVKNRDRFIEQNSYKLTEYEQKKPEYDMCIKGLLEDCEPGSLNYNLIVDGFKYLEEIYNSYDSLLEGFQNQIDKYTEDYNETYRALQIYKEI